MSRTAKHSRAEAKPSVPDTDPKIERESDKSVERRFQVKVRGSFNVSAFSEEDALDDVCGLIESGALSGMITITERN